MPESFFFSSKILKFGLCSRLHGKFEKKGLTLAHTLRDFLEALTLGQPAWVWILSPPLTSYVISNKLPNHSVSISSSVK